MLSSCSRHLFVASLAICHANAQIQNVTSSRLSEKVGGKANTTNAYDFIDPLIGISNGGHVFPGATLPFGMAKAGADVLGEENQGGFSSDNPVIYGFSHMHDSGTGGSPSLGNFPIFVQTTCAEDNTIKCAFGKTGTAASYNLSTVRAHPGYFAVDLDTGVKAEMTTTNRTSLYRFTLPERPVGLKDSKMTVSPFVTIELTDLPNSRRGGFAHIDDKTARMTGNGTFEPSFGIGNYTLHFCVDFKGASIRDTGVWVNTRSSTSAKSVRVMPDGVNKPVFPAGAFVRFNTPTGARQILARVATSFISAEQACKTAEVEIPTFDFNGTLATAQDAWREKLRNIDIDTGGASINVTKSFWSGIYRSMISPQDYTGENPLWKSKEPYYDSYYCIWDSFRGIHQLLTLLDPQSQTLMVRSMIDIYRHEGYLPDCRMSLCKGFTQGGSNADTLLVDSWLKGIYDDVDWNTGYEAMIKDAEIEPAIWSVEGRGGLNSWKTLGFIPKDDFDPYGSGALTRSVSRTVEYAYNDFNIATMANFTGREADYHKYIERSENWRNVFNPGQNSTLNNRTFVGFAQPRLENRTWAFQDPLQCSNELDFFGCYLNPDGKETYEGSPWLYTFYVPGDMASLIKVLGGRQALVDRLDFFHATNISYIGDEQFFLPVFLYHYAGRPGLSSLRAHYYIEKFFFAAPSGLPGNDDSGAMGSFAALTMMGIFPNPGQNVYFITPPFFQEVSITSRVTGRKATIRNVNFDPSYKNKYVQSAKLNGKPWNRNWLSHDFFLEGGVLELVLGDSESQWGTREADLPPSLSTTGLAPRTTIKKEWYGGGGKPIILRSATNLNI